MQFQNRVSPGSSDTHNEVRARRGESRGENLFLPSLCSKEESPLICPVFTFPDLTLGIVPYWVISFDESFYVSFSKTTAQLAQA